MLDLDPRSGCSCGAGNAILTAYGLSTVSRLLLTPDGLGTYGVTVGPVLESGHGGGLEGLRFVAAGNPAFSANSAIVAEWTSTYGAFQLDASGAPIASTRRQFATTASGDAVGLVVDPLTGDLLVPDFEDHTLYIVSGFTVLNQDAFSGGAVPEPASLGAAALAGLALLARRRRARGR